MCEILGGKTIQDALSELLASEGFERMAKDVKIESDKGRLATYARIIIKNAPENMKYQLKLNFQKINLI